MRARMTRVAIWRSRPHWPYRWPPRPGDHRPDGPAARAVGLRAARGQQPAPVRPDPALRAFRLQAGGLRRARHGRGAEGRRDDHARRLRRAGRPRRQRPRRVVRRGLRDRRGPAGPARAVPPRDQGTLAEVLGKSRLRPTSRRAATTTPTPSCGACSSASRVRCARASPTTPRASTPTRQRSPPTHARAEGVRAARAQAGDWTALDSVRIGIQLARTIPSSDGAELANWTALRQLGAKRFDRLLPVCRKGELTTVPAPRRPLPVDAGAHRRRRAQGLREPRRFLAHVTPPKASASAASVSAPPGQLPALGGSNAWAVRGPRPESYLFHGPQLGFAVPDTLVELEVHRPGLDVRGVTAPGLPVIGIGRNAHIAWGETSGLPTTTTSTSRSSRAPTATSTRARSAG